MDLPLDLRDYVRVPRKLGEQVRQHAGRGVPPRQENAEQLVPDDFVGLPGLEKLVEKDVFAALVLQALLVLPLHILDVLHDILLHEVGVLYESAIRKTLSDPAQASAPGHLVGGTVEAGGELDRLGRRGPEGVGRVPEHEIRDRVYGEHGEQRLEIEAGPVLRDAVDHLRDVPVEALDVGDLVPDERRPQRPPRVVPLGPVRREDGVAAQERRERLYAALRDDPVLEIRSQDRFDVLGIVGADGERDLGEQLVHEGVPYSLQVLLSLREQRVRPDVPRRL